ncbi:sensor histidine kinase [Occultella gossypii]|uniref:histidine kinase n=1 Tax=Occultella gossypii TaxID=2800820 RepID=A0ABS7SFU9_9MICO|nr:histidine kinase [Occultella gossypii]MBZ2198639.1 histidine kinase [Occultella gossypii]
MRTLQDVCATDPRRPPPQVTAVTMLGLAALAGLTLVSMISNAPSTAFVVLDVGVAVASVLCVPLLACRPVPGAAALALLATLSPVATTGSTMGTYYVARNAPLPDAVGIAVIGFGAHLVQFLWRPMPGIDTLWFVLLDAAAHAALLGVGALFRSRAEVIRSLHERAARAEADRDRHADEARLAERARIAREMHDVLAHRLSLLATYAGALEYRPDAPPEQVARAAGVLRTGTHEALEDLREVIGVLRLPDGDGPDRPRPQPDVPEIGRLIATARASGMEIAYSAGYADPTTLPGASARTGYRIVQEALTNARKHAPGAPVRVRVDGEPGEGLNIEVSNDAPTRPADATLVGSSAGLIGLAERVDLAHGRLTHGPHAQGFRVVAWLPWPR